MSTWVIECLSSHKKGKSSPGHCMYIYIHGNIGESLIKVYVIHRRIKKVKLYPLVRVESEEKEHIKNTAINIKTNKNKIIFT